MIIPGIQIRITDPVRPLLLAGAVEDIDNLLKLLLLIREVIPVRASDPPPAQNHRVTTGVVNTSAHKNPS